MKRKNRLFYLLLSLAVCFCLTALPLSPVGALGAFAEETPAEETEAAKTVSRVAAPTEYRAVKTFSADAALKGDKIASDGQDENAVLVTGGEVALNGVTLSRESAGSAGGALANEYGVGAALLATGGRAYVANAEIKTASKGSAGAFSYGDGTVYLADTRISTSEPGAGGLQVAGGGKLYAWDLDVSTGALTSGAVTGSGDGALTVNGGTYNAAAAPAVKAGADITIANATLTSPASDGATVSDKHTLLLFDTSLSCNMADDLFNDCTWSVLLNDEKRSDNVGKTTFQMSGGELHSANGGLFYTTNAESEVRLTNVKIEAAPDCEFLLRCTGNASRNGWGTPGSNGADCTFIAAQQEMAGDVLWDADSELDMYLFRSASLTGAFRQVDAAGEDGDREEGGLSGRASLFISEDSIWTVTESCRLTALYNENGNAAISDLAGNAVTIKGTNGTVYLNGPSDLTVTVDVYSDTANFEIVDRFVAKGDSLADVPELLQSKRHEKTTAPEGEGQTDYADLYYNSQQAQMKRVVTLIVIVAGACLTLIVILRITGAVSARRRTRERQRDRWEE